MFILENVIHCSPLVIFFAARMPTIPCFNIGINNSDIEAGNYGHSGGKKRTG